jgi:hypothetical protein
MWQHSQNEYRLQPEGLKRDLQLWSTGLFPFFEYAATSVKVRRMPFPAPFLLTYSYSS